MQKEYAKKIIGGWIIIKSVCSNSFNPAAKKNGGVSLNGSRTIAISNNVSENPKTTLSLKSRDCDDSTNFPVIGLRQIQASKVSQTTHIRIGPSRAAQVAANRYL